MTPKRRQTHPPFSPGCLHRAFLAAFLSPVAAACGDASGGASTTSDGGSAADARLDVSVAGEGAAMSDANGSMGHDAPSGGDASASDSAVVVPCTLDAGLPDASSCVRYTFPPCGYDGGDLSSECSALCPVSDAGQSLAYCNPSASNGVTLVQCNYCGIPGRRPEGLGAAPPQPLSLGAYFARCAWLEAASVSAFRRLSRELRALAAGDALVAAAERAARQEVRHARLMMRFANLHGVEAVAPRVERLGVRDALSVALENAVEGCVREAYGALVAKWQAERVTEIDLKRALASIARDEEQHAVIAWQVAAWLEPKLSAAERERIDDARRAAVEALRTELVQDPPTELAQRVGLPSACEALRLLRALDENVVAPLSRVA